MKSPVDWSLTSKITMAFWLVMVLFFLARLQSLQSLLKLSDTSTVLARAAEMEALLHETVVRVMTLETAELGFVLTGESAALANRPRAEAVLSSRLRHLRVVVSESPALQSRFAPLETAVSNRLALGRQLVEARRAQGLAAAERLVQEGNLPIATHRVRQAAEEFKRDEEALRRQRLREVDKRLQHRLLTFSLFTAFEFGLLTLAYSVVSLYTRERSRREKALYEDGQVRAAIIATQYDITAIQPDLEQVMKLIVQRTQDLTRAQGASIELVEGEDLVVRAAGGEAVSFSGRRFPRAESLAGLAVETDEILVCEDAAQEQRKDRDVFRKAGFRSMIVVPLHHEGERIGALRLVWTKPATFGEREIQTMVLMSGFLSAAMVNATRLADHRRRERDSASPSPS
jgi:CHASE3 domain sensor protein/putative methionine-R-sulfoxide reductase with GAF domain